MSYSYIISVANSEAILLDDSFVPFSSDCTGEWLIFDYPYKYGTTQDLSIISNEVDFLIFLLTRLIEHKKEVYDILVDNLIMQKRNSDLTITIDDFEHTFTRDSFDVIKRIFASEDGITLYNNTEWANMVK